MAAEGGLSASVGRIWGDTPAASLSDYTAMIYRDRLTDTTLTTLRALA